MRNYVVYIIIYLYTFQKVKAVIIIVCTFAIEYCELALLG